MRISGNGIKTTRIPWVATRETAQSKAQTLERSVFFNGFGSVFRTTRKKTATLPEQRADGKSIEANQRQQQDLHTSPSSYGHFFQQAANLACQIFPVKLSGTTGQTQNQIPGQQIWPHGAKALPRQAANQIAINRPAQQAFGHHQSQPGTLCLGRNLNSVM